jgi:hypothetical protein
MLQNGEASVSTSLPDEETTLLPRGTELVSTGEHMANDDNLPTKCALVNCSGSYLDFVAAEIDPAVARNHVEFVRERTSKLPAKINCGETLTNVGELPQWVYDELTVPGEIKSLSKKQCAMVYKINNLKLTPGESSRSLFDKFMQAWPNWQTDLAEFEEVTRILDLDITYDDKTDIANKWFGIRGRPN